MDDMNASRLFVVMTESGDFAAQVARAEEFLPHSLTPAGLDAHVRVKDQLGDQGVFLVALSETGESALRRAAPKAIILRASILEMLWLRKRPVVADAAAAMRIGPAVPPILLTVKVVDAKSGEPLVDVIVFGFTDRTNNSGAEGITGKGGVAKLEFAGVTQKAVLETLEAHPALGYWSTFETHVSLTASCVTLRCVPIDFATGDVRRHFMLEGHPALGKGVRVGVIDTGVSDHADLSIAKAMSVTINEDVNDYADDLGHGTHVAGIIAGTAKDASTGMVGAAPGVELYVYRVFRRGFETAYGFDIAKGITQAVKDGCDLINLSLGSASTMPEVELAVEEAAQAGVVCIAAVGNDYGAEVAYPARYALVLAVSAMGRKGSWPPGALHELEVQPPPGTDPANFVAAFSNTGSAVNLISPGVAIVSTVPGGYMAFDGTSMACPLATGIVAGWLSTSPHIKKLPRDRNRYDAIVGMVLGRATSIGFEPRLEGAGFLR